MMKRIGWTAFGAIVIAAGSLSLAAIVALDRASAPRLHGTVAAVGGCSNSGWCGVLLDDGSYCIAPLPVVGRRIECDAR